MCSHKNYWGVNPDKAKNLMLSCPMYFGGIKKMKKEIYFPGVVFSFLIIFVVSCGPVHKQVRLYENINKVKNLAIVVPSEPEFTVIYDRAKATDMPVLFGLVGVAVAAGYNQSQDNAKAKILVPESWSLSCLLFFLESLCKTLKEAGRFDEVKVFDKELESKDISRHDAVVTFIMKYCGVRVAERETDQLASFVELEITMIQTHDNQTLWDEHEVVLGKGRYSFDSYKGDKELLQNDLKETVETAGFSMASRLIYQ